MKKLLIIAICSISFHAQADQYKIVKLGYCNPLKNNTFSCRTQKLDDCKPLSTGGVVCLDDNGEYITHVEYAFVQIAKDKNN